MDLQKMFNAVGDACRESRKPYHLSLGALADLANENPSAKVIVDGEGGLGREGSYRGYYDDLSFEPTNEPGSAEELAKACDRALVHTYEGYKGGEYNYDKDTPLWLAGYGDTGVAIVSAEVRDGDIHLSTRRV